MACTTLLPPCRTTPSSSYDQHQHDPTEQAPLHRQERRERDGLLGVGGGMDRANIDNLFPARVGDALISKSDDSPKRSERSQQALADGAHSIPSLVTKPKSRLDSSSLKQIDH